MTLTQAYAKIDQLQDQLAAQTTELYGKIDHYQIECIRALKERNALMVEVEMARQVARTILYVARLKTGEPIVNDAVLEAHPWLKEGG